MLVHPCGSFSPTRAPEGFKDHRHCRSDEHQHPTPQAQDTGFIRQVFLAMGLLPQHAAKPQPRTWLLEGPLLPGEPTAARMMAGTRSSERRQVLGTAPQARARDGGSQIPLCTWQQSPTLLGATSGSGPSQRASFPARRALYSLPGRQIEEEDATWLSSALIPWSGRRLGRTP